MPSPIELVRKVDFQIKDSLSRVGFRPVHGVFVRRDAQQDTWPTVGTIKVKHESDVSYRIDPTVGIHVPGIERLVVRWLGRMPDDSSMTMVLRFDVLSPGRIFRFVDDTTLSRRVDDMVAEVVKTASSKFWNLYQTADAVVDGIQRTRYGSPFRRELAPAAYYVVQGDLDNAQSILATLASNGRLPAQLSEAVARALDDIRRGTVS